MGYQENFLPAEQKKSGNEVEIVTADRIPDYKVFNKKSGKYSSERIIGVGIFRDVDICIHRLICSFEIKNGGLLKLKGLKDKLKELKPDVVHTHGAFSISTFQVIIYSKKLGYDVIVDDHSHKNNFHLDSFAKKTYVRLAKIFYKIYGKRILYWIPVTYSAKQILQDLLKLPEEKIELLHLGADTDNFKISIELRKIGRLEYNIPDDTYLIISTGKFDVNKDIHNLINGLKKISEVCPKIKLLLIGNGPNTYMQKLRDLVNSNGLENEVIFKNFITNSELPKYYNSADLGVWPGDHSITVIEAVATGLPVIIPKDDLAYKVLFNDNAAMGYERGNVESLSNALLKLIQNQKLRTELSDNSTNLATEVLSWKQIAKKSIYIYSSGNVIRNDRM